jgi:DNA-binding transcriptional LysR family regulator
VGATQAAGRTLNLVALFGEYHRRFPDIQLTAISGPAPELVGDLRGGALDVVLVAGGYTGDDLQWVTLVESEPLVAVVGLEHPLADRKRVRLAELAATGALVEFRDGTGLAERVAAAFAAAEASPRTSLRLGRISDMVRFASHGFGAAIVPRKFASEPPAGADAYVTLRLAEKLDICIGVAHRSGRPTPALRAFLQLLEAHSRVLS